MTRHIKAFLANESGGGAAGFVVVLGAIGMSGFLYGAGLATAIGTMKAWFASLSLVPLW